MKNLLPFFLLILSLSLTTCRKELPCTSYTALTNRDHLVDITPLKDDKQFMGILNKYPQLQVQQVINDEYSLGMNCNVFYKDLLIFTGYYQFFKGKIHPGTFVFENMPDTIGISLIPTIDYKQAIDIAKRRLDFRNMCISYRLGIYDINAGSSDMPKEYRLTWMVQSEYGNPVVYLDANSGEVYSSDDGIRY